MYFFFGTFVAGVIGTVLSIGIHFELSYPGAQLLQVNTQSYNVLVTTHVIFMRFLDFNYGVTDRLVFIFSTVFYLDLVVPPYCSEIHLWPIAYFTRDYLLVKSKMSYLFVGRFERNEDFTLFRRSKGVWTELYHRPL